MTLGQETKTEVVTRPGWHASEASAVARELEVEPERGLSVEKGAEPAPVGWPEPARRRQKGVGPAGVPAPYRDVMQLILLAATAISLVVTGDVATSVVLSAADWIKLVIRQRDRRRVAAAPQLSVSGA